jgi:hypothetical protein
VLRPFRVLDAHVAHTTRWRAHRQQRLVQQQRLTCPNSASATAAVCCSPLEYDIPGRRSMSRNQSLPRENNVRWIASSTASRLRTTSSARKRNTKWPFSWTDWSLRRSRRYASTPSKCCAPSSSIAIRASSQSKSTSIRPQLSNGIGNSAFNRKLFRTSRNMSQHHDAGNEAVPEFEFSAHIDARLLGNARRAQTADTLAGRR